MKDARVAKSYNAAERELYSALLATILYLSEDDWSYRLYHGMKHRYPDIDGQFTGYFRSHQALDVYRLYSLPTVSSSMSIFLGVTDFTLRSRPLTNVVDDWLPIENTKVEGQLKPLASYNFSGERFAVIHHHIVAKALCSLSKNNDITFSLELLFMKAYGIWVMGDGRMKIHLRTLNEGLTDANVLCGVLQSFAVKGLTDYACICFLGFDN